MSIETLLSSARVLSDGTVRQTKSKQDGPRPAFAKDWDSILFSAQFRRLQDKTQLFPLPDKDFVHSRLTHSLEVASVGRDLGRWVGRQLFPKRDLADGKEDVEHRMGDVVAAACLAHDIGNPPFGHAGEQAISDYFRSDGQQWIQELSFAQRADFEHFDGNAQGFRVLTRLGLEASMGLRLTAATLAAFTKYPTSSTAADNEKEPRKYGFFEAEREIFKATATEVGLMRAGEERFAWARHPLACLVERADDICNRVIDLEDGYRLEYLDHECVESIFKEAAGQLDSDDRSRLRKLVDEDRVCFLRARAISQLIKTSVEEFTADKERFLSGQLQPVTPPSLEKMLAIEKEHLFGLAEVLELELVGAKVIKGLLSEFCIAVHKDCLGLQKTRAEMRALSLLRAHRVFGDKTNAGASPLYEALLRITDYVSGMTDRHALSVYRKLTGMSLPARFR